jgi:methyl-accepting chemotaxis protein
MIALRESHRIVGPVERLTGALADLADGRISYVGAVRKGDLLKGLDDDINTLSENLARMDGRLQEVLGGLKRELEQFDQAGELTEDGAKRIREITHEMEDALGFFNRS